MSIAVPAPIDADDAMWEAGSILDRAAEAGLMLRGTGGVAVALISPSARRPPLRRDYQDIDFFALSRDADALSRFFTGLGYRPEQEFNVLHGQRRLFFRHPEGRWEADVFLDRVEMCHQLDLRAELETHDRTLSPANLLLSKLQVVETNDKDLQDTLALIADHDLGETAGEISLRRIADVCTSDWGWWRTVTLVAGRAREAASRLADGADAQGTDALQRADDRLERMVRHLETAPKSRRWKLRAMVGEHKRWYETPEDIEHEEHS